MGGSWEKLGDDPLVHDIRLIVNRGLHWFSADELTVLPELLSDNGGVADEAMMRRRLLGLLMADDPGKTPASAELGHSTQINLALFGATAQTRHMTANGRREVAGEIYRPTNPVSADGVRRRPSAKQPRGGLEWRVIADLRGRILDSSEQSAAEAGRRPEPPPAPAPAGRRLGDLVRAELTDLYQPIRERDFENSFFHRESTNAYIEQLAGLDAVTLFTAGAPSPDVHAPLSDKLMARTLRERLRRSATDLESHQLDTIVDALMRTFPPPYLGSIARELVREQSTADRDDVAGLEADAQDVFTRELRDAVEAGRDASGFLALGLGALAFALKRAGRETVQLLTSNYDDRLAEAETRVHEYFGELRDYSFVPRPLTAGSEAPDDAVPLYRLNGHIGAQGGGGIDPLIIGEADSLTDHYAARSRVMAKALETTSCIFVGSTLGEPDVLSKLVNATYPLGRPRYTILLAPPLGLDDPGERAKALNLTALRFLHLGIVPIVIDFPHQAPQFLIEVALRLQHPQYANYAERLDSWWREWVEDFGFAGRAGERNPALQQLWMDRLAAIRDTIADQHLELSKRRRRREHLQLEMWIRHPGERSLVHWAGSDGLWLNAASARRLSIPAAAEDPVQRAFRDGTPFHGPVSQQNGRWHYQLSIPVVLRKEPWHHLPVGVVNILSTGTPSDGRLASFHKREGYATELQRLAGTVKRPVNELLDPRSGAAKAASET
jgi:hypothetical protein